MIRLKALQCLCEHFKNRPSRIHLEDEQIAPTINAMCELSQQQAVAFAQWMLEKDIRSYDGERWDDVERDEISYTSAELYKKFLEENK